MKKSGAIGACSRAIGECLKAPQKDSRAALATAAGPVSANRTGLASKQSSNCSYLGILRSKIRSSEEPPNPVIFHRLYHRMYLVA